MKKRILAAALLVWSVLPALADDASVLPGRVLRVYAVPTYVSVNGSYDQDGKYQKPVDTATPKVDAFNVGAAVEYGVTDWWGLGIQWTPGYTLASKVDLKDTGYSDPKANINGPADVFVGGKFLLVGPKSPIASETWRFAVSPGVIIPFGALDAKAQAKNLSKGDDVTVSDSDKHVFAYGGRLFLDYVMNHEFFVDLYGEYIQYTQAKGRKVFVPSSALAAGVGTNVFKADLDYGNKITLQLEPHYTLPVGGDDYSISFGLPATYVATAKTKVSTDSTTKTTLGLAGKTTDILGAHDAGYTLDLTPSASVFFYKTPIVLPIELKADYNLPLAGKNNSATTYFDLQIRAYAQF